MKKSLLASVAFAATAFAADVEIQPYGFVLINTHLTSGLTSPSDIPVYALDGDDDKSFLITARQTRFGLKAKGPDVGTAKLDGVIELDFWGLKGSTPAGGVGQSAPRLRLANFKLAWQNTTLVVGQDWVQTFAPLLPTTLAHQSIPEFSSSGNLWNRLAQIRLEQNFKVAEKSKFTLGAALLRPFGADVTELAPTQPDALGGGEKSGIPFVQVRGAFTAPMGEKTMTIGASAQLGQQQYKEADMDSQGFALDLSVPFGKKLALSGEGYVGKNLKGFFSNAGVLGNPDENSNAEEAKVKGGWAQLWVGLGDKGGVNAGYGLESLDKDQITAGLLKNETIFGNYIHSLNKNFKIAFEVNHIRTTRRAGNTDKTVDATVFDVAGQFIF